MKLLFLFAAFLLTLSKASIGEFALKTEDGQVAVGEGTDLMRNPFENPRIEPDDVYYNLTCIYSCYGDCGGL